MPLKGKDRPESWSSNASSPEEKKAREKNHSALESESEDYILKALNMADNLGSYCLLILNKLNKLDSIELRLETLNKSVASIEESFKHSRSKHGEQERDHLQFYGTRATNPKRSKQN